MQNCCFNTIVFQLFMPMLLFDKLVAFYAHFNYVTPSIGLIVYTQTWIFYTRFQYYVHRRHLCSSLDMAFKWLKDCLAVKQAIFQIISWRKDKEMRPYLGFSGYGIFAEKITGISDIWGKSYWDTGYWDVVSGIRDIRKKLQHIRCLMRNILGSLNTCLFLY